MTNPDYDDFDETDDPIDDEVDDTDAANSGDDGHAVSSKEKDKEKDILADAESLSVSSKEAERLQLEEEMARFLAAGGKIRQIPPDESADPPKFSTSSYGSKPI